LQEYFRSSTNFGQQNGGLFCVSHRWCEFIMAKATALAHSCPMKIAEAVRKFAAEPSLSEEEALKKGVEEKSRKFTEKGSELYAKA
jgi:hypothetical protein